VQCLVRSPYGTGRGISGHAKPIMRLARTADNTLQVYKFIKLIYSYNLNNKLPMINYSLFQQTVVPIACIITVKFIASV